MSECRAKAERLLKFRQFRVAFTQWLCSEPPMWRVFSWHRWKLRRPKYFP